MSDDIETARQVWLKYEREIAQQARDGTQVNVDMQGVIAIARKPQESSIADKIERPKLSFWVSVKDRLPEDSGDFLLLTSEETYKVGFWNFTYSEWIMWHECCNYHGKIHEQITHWMPLPDPPTAPCPKPS